MTPRPRAWLCGSTLCRVSLLPTIISLQLGAHMCAPCPHSAGRGPARARAPRAPEGGGGRRAGGRQPPLRRR